MTGYEGSHQDWLEDQADDVLQREEIARDTFVATHRHLSPARKFDIQVLTLDNDYVHVRSTTGRVHDISLELFNTQYEAIPSDRFPLPGQPFDDGITVASGWVDDSHIGVLTIVDEPGAYYRIGGYRRAGNGWECHWVIAAENIVPAARIFNDEFGFWGGN